MTMKDSYVIIDKSPDMPDGPTGPDGEGINGVLESGGGYSFGQYSIQGMVRGHCWVGMAEEDYNEY
jgi:hypothetical protein